MIFPEKLFKDIHTLRPEDLDCILPEDWTFQIKSHMKVKSNKALLKFPNDIFKDMLPPKWNFKVKTHRKPKTNEAIMSLFVEYPCGIENFKDVDVDFLSDMILIGLQKIHSENWMFGSVKPDFNKESVIFEFACIQV